MAPTWTTPSPLTNSMANKPVRFTASDIQACNEAIDNGVLAVPSTDEALPDAFAQLQDHPVLTGYLDQLTFDGYHIDGLPSLVDASEGSQLSGGNEPREPSRAYIHQNEVRFSQGIIAIWALTDVEEGDGGFCFVPASHKSCVDTPDDLTRGTDDMVECGYHGGYPFLGCGFSTELKHAIHSAY